MRLAEFITANADAILAEWVAFAATCSPAGKTMDLAGLRDHAQAMLTEIVADLNTPQTPAEQVAKSKGDAEPGDEDAETPAEVHGADRAESGFTVGEMVSEYRALRASVIRLWVKESGTLAGEDLEDLMRFNEAIDQALTQSVSRYTEDLDRSKELFLAILGHDLRSPLGAVITSSQFMLDNGDLAEPNLTLTGGIARSARRMSKMVGDLLDFTRSRLGSGVPIVRKEIDLATVAQHAVEEIAAALPASRIDFRAHGDLHGAWDDARMSQVLVNLIGNAAEHGSANEPITVTAEGETNSVVLRVHNQGPPIRRRDIRELFSPLKHLRAGEEAVRDSSNLGLGLYIAERIVVAHRGTITVASSANEGTTFTVCLPR